MLWCLGWLRVALGLMMGASTPAAQGSWADVVGVVDIAETRSGGTVGGEVGVGMLRLLGDGDL